MSALAGLIPLLNRIDALIKKMDELITVMTGKVPEGVPEVPEIIVPAPQVVVERLNNRYLIVEIDTSVARTDEPIGLKNMLLKQGVEYARYMTILDVGGGFTYKLNTTGVPALTGQVGAEHEFEIEEIFITNSAAAGTARLFIEYRVE